MTVETGDYISDLVPTAPNGAEPIAQGDDHLRLIKKVLQNTFKGMVGAIITGAKGSLVLPAGLTADRDATPVQGAERFNTELNGWEGWNGAAWVSIGGGQMYGKALVKAIFFNSQTIAEDVTVKAGENGGTFGPVTVNDGFTVTVEAGSVWTIC